MTEPNFRARWAQVDQSTKREVYIELLNRLRADDDPVGFPNTMAWLEPQAGERLLEVGCGNGVVARAVTRFMPSVQEVIGIDASRSLIAEARHQLGDRVLPVQFLVADAMHLPFPDESFDQCYAMEVFVILPDPYAAFLEIERVTRPGGRLCMWETDCDTRAMLGPDLDLTRRLMRFIGDEEYQGAAARQLIGWCKERGWSTTIVPTLNIADEPSPLVSTLLTEWLEDAVSATAITPQERDLFRMDLQSRQERRTYFAYTVSFRIIATKTA